MNQAELFNFIISSYTIEQLLNCQVLRFQLNKNGDQLFYVVYRATGDLDYPECFFLSKVKNIKWKHNTEKFPSVIVHFNGDKEIYKPDHIYNSEEDEEDEDVFYCSRCEDY